MINKINWKDIPSLKELKNPEDVRKEFRGKNCIIYINEIAPPMSSEVAETPTIFDKHPSEQINWLIQGSGRSYQGEKTIDLEEGDIVYIAPDVPHTFRPLGDKKVILVNILSPIPDR